MRSPLHIPLVRYSCRGRVHELYCNFASVHTGLIPSSYQRRLNSSGLMRRNQQFQKLAAISLEVIKRRWYKECNRHVFAQRRRARLLQAEGEYTAHEWLELLARVPSLPPVWEAL